MLIERNTVGRNVNIKFFRCSKLAMGPGTLEIKPELFRINRNRLVEDLKTKAPNGIVFLQGGSEIPFYDTDTTYIFRQVCSCKKSCYFSTKFSKN